MRQSRRPRRRRHSPSICSVVLARSLGLALRFHSTLHTQSIKKLLNINYS